MTTDYDFYSHNQAVKQASTMLCELTVKSPFQVSTFSFLAVCFPSQRAVDRTIIVGSMHCRQTHNDQHRHISNDPTIVKSPLYCASGLLNLQPASLSPKMFLCDGHAVTCPLSSPVSPPSSLITHSLSPVGEIASHLSVGVPSVSILMPSLLYIYLIPECAPMLITAHVVLYS